MSVSITKDSRRSDNWVVGTVDGCKFEAKVYDQPSDYGIKGGRVSKLWIKGADEVVASYERGWGVRPNTSDGKRMVDEVVKKMESLPRAFPLEKDDEVIYKGKHYVVSDVAGGKATLSDDRGAEVTVSTTDTSVLLINSCARNAVCSRNAVVQKALNAWVPSRGSAHGYQWKDSSAEKRIMSELRTAGATDVVCFPSAKDANFGTLAWSVSAQEDDIGHVAKKMGQLGMTGVSKPKHEGYDMFSVIGYTKTAPMPKNACARNAGRVVSNGIGDSYSDGVHFLEEAYKVVGTPAKAKGLVRRARESVSYVAKYDYADDGDKATMSKCLADIDKAASSPTEDTIKEARWTCEKARAKADGGSPRRTFWNACRAVRNAVVAKALNACARNTIGGDKYTVEFNNGMKVDTEAHSEDEAKFNLSRMAARFGGIKSVAKNACDAARNADYQNMNYDERWAEVRVRADRAYKEVSECAKILGIIKREDDEAARRETAAKRILDEIRKLA